MLDHVSADYLANVVVMLRATVGGAIWVPEDEDEAVFYQRCAHKDALIIPASRDVIPLIERLGKDGIQGLVGTTRGLPRPVAQNVFQPQLGDVASLLISSESSGVVIRDICGASWLAASEREVGSICQRAAWIAHVFQGLRLASAEAAGRPLDELNPSELIDWNNFGVDWAALALVLADASVPDRVLEEARGTAPSKTAGR